MKLFSDLIKQFCIQCESPIIVTCWVIQVYDFVGGNLKKCYAEIGAILIYLLLILRGRNIFLWERMWLDLLLIIIENCFAHADRYSIRRKRLKFRLFPYDYIFNYLN